MAAAGKPKKGGRQRGALNKTTAALKDMILEALEGAGGVDYLTKQAKENPVAFLALLGKILPMQLSHSGTIGLSGLLEAARKRISDEHIS